MGQFGPTLENVIRLTMQLVDGGKKATDIILKGEDEVKLKYLTSTMAASNTSIGPYMKIDCSYL